MTKSTTERVLECFGSKQGKWPWCIAGGALRDSWFDKEVKDVDLFIWKTKGYFDDHLTQNYFYLAINGDSPHYNWDGIGYRFEKQGEEYGTSHFMSFRSDEVPGLNIILLRWPEKLDYGIREVDCDKVVPELLASFPASISKIAYNSQWDKWWIDPDFDEGLKSNTIFCEGDRNGREYYLKKLWDKYKTWTVEFE